MCVRISLYTTVVHNTAHSSFDYLPSCSRQATDLRRCLLKGGGIMTVQSDYVCMPSVYLSLTIQAEQD